jgi:hypothetical protein
MGEVFESMHFHAGPSEPPQIYSLIFDKGVKAVQGRKDGLLQTVLEQLHIAQKPSLSLNFTPYTRKWLPNGLWD